MKSSAEAAAEADIIMILAPDTSQARIYREAIAPHLSPGKTLMFGHGFNIRYAQIVPPAGVDVSLVAPKSPGTVCVSCTSMAWGRPADGSPSGCYR